MANNLDKAYENLRGLLRDYGEQDPNIWRWKISSGMLDAYHNAVEREIGLVEHEEAAHYELNNERYKAVCELRKMDLSTGGFLKRFAEAIGVKWKTPVVSTMDEVRDRLIHLLGGDQSQVPVSMGQENGTNGTDNGTCPNDVPIASITDELRERIAGVCKVFGLSGEKLYGIADRIDQAHQDAMESVHDSMETECDKLQSELDKWKRLADTNAKALLRINGENANLRRAAKRDADVIDNLSGHLADKASERMELPTDMNVEPIASGDVVEINDKKYKVMAVSQEHVWINAFDDDPYRLVGYPSKLCELVADGE